MEKQPTSATEIKKRHQEAIKDLKFNLGLKKYVLDPLVLSAAGLTAGTFAASVYDLAVMQQGLTLDNLAGTAGSVGAAFGVRAVSGVINKDARASSGELRLLEAVPPEEVSAPPANIEYLPPSGPEAEKPALAA